MIIINSIKTGNVLIVRSRPKCARLYSNPGYWRDSPAMRCHVVEKSAALYLSYGDERCLA